MGCWGTNIGFTRRSTPSPYTHRMRSLSLPARRRNTQRYTNASASACWHGKNAFLSLTATMLQQPLSYNSHTRLLSVVLH